MKNRNRPNDLGDIYAEIEDRRTPLALVALTFMVVAVTGVLVVRLAIAFLQAGLLAF